MTNPTALALTTVLLAVSCDGEGTATPSPLFPPGTALAVSGAPVSAREVEDAADAVRSVYPDRSRLFHVRQGLQSFVLPRAALRAAYADERRLADARCLAAWDSVRSGEAPAAQEQTGTWNKLSLFYWNTARRLEPGAWSGPQENIGRFCIVQLVHRQAGALPREDVLTLKVLEFPYVPASFSPEQLDSALGAARLEVIDPAFEPFVPEQLRYKMNGDRP